MIWIHTFTLDSASVSRFKHGKLQPYTVSVRSPPIVTIMDGAFNVFDGYHDRQNGLCTNFSRQLKGNSNGITWCEQTFMFSEKLKRLITCVEYL